MQHVESYWNRIKTKLKRMKGCHAKQLPSYLDEFMWCERHHTWRDKETSIPQYYEGYCSTVSCPIRVTNQQLHSIKKEKNQKQMQKNLSLTPSLIHSTTLTVIMINTTGFFQSHYFSKDYPFYMQLLYFGSMTRNSIY